MDFAHEKQAVRNKTTQSLSIDKLGSQQNGLHFSDDIYKFTVMK